MIQYANMGWAYSRKHDSLAIARETVDSCWKFIEKYPHSFAKPNIFAMMLEMTRLFTYDMNKINLLIDSVLFYDKLAGTRLRVGEILIDRNLDLRKGRNLVVNAYPELTVKFHKFRAYIRMARSDLLLGNYSSAQINYEKALQIEPDRLSAWYEFLGYARMNELSGKTNYIKSKIKELENKDVNDYAQIALTSRNINQSVSEIILKDLDGKPVKFSQFEGKVIVINRFNFWCAWCIKEFPTLKKN